jgi:hypothetical protein
MTNDKMTDCGYVSRLSPVLSGANASWDPDFVPEGLNDRSQAIYCLGKIPIGVRPVGNGMIGVLGLFHHPGSNNAIDRSNQTVPMGRDRHLARVQAFHAWLPSFSPSGTKDQRRQTYITA